MNTFICRIVVLGVAIVLIFSSCLCAQSSAIPPEPRQREIQTQLNETLGLPRVKTFVEKERVVEELIKMSSDTEVAKDELYVILQTAFPLIRDVGNYEAHQLAVTRYLSVYSTEPLKDRTALLVEFISACKNSKAIDPAVIDLAKLADDEGRENRFEDALDWINTADRAARKLKSRVAIERLVICKTQLTDRQNAFQAQEKAAKILESNPDDAKANLAMGFWLAVFQDEWDQAIPFLAKGSDPKWQAAAKAESTASADIESRIRIADAWYEVSQSIGPARSIVRQRALDIYTRAEDELSSPIAKAKVSKRKAELMTALKSKVVDAPLRSRAKRAEDQVVGLPRNETLEILDWVIVSEHTVEGEWTREPSGHVVSGMGLSTRFMLPVSLTGSYQVNLRFTRRQNTDTVGVILPIGNQQVQFFVDGWYGNVSGLQLVDGNEGREGAPATIKQSKPFEIGVEHELQIVVKQQGEDVEISTQMDGESLLTWKGKSSQLSLTGNMTLPNPRCLAIAVWSSVVAIEDVKLKLLDDGQGYRLGKDWKNPLTDVAAVPPLEVQGKCFDWQGRKYFLTDVPILLPAAQELAAKLHGRLLTISTAEEEKMIFQKGGGRKIWLSAWCGKDRVWRDERNRPLRFTGKWAVRDGVTQPDNWEKRQNQLAIFTTDSFGWDDVSMDLGGYHACIEWGEEYTDSE